METVVESGKRRWSPGSKHQIQVGMLWSYEGRLTRRDGTAESLARETKLLGARGDREEYEDSFFHEQDEQPYPRLMSRLLKVMTTPIHPPSTTFFSYLLSTRPVFDPT